MSQRQALNPMIVVAGLWVLVGLVLIALIGEVSSVALGSIALGVAIAATALALRSSGEGPSETMRRAAWDVRDTARALGDTSPDPAPGTPPEQAFGTAIERLRSSALACSRVHEDEARQLLGVIDAFGEPMLATDASGMVVFANAPASVLLQREAARIVGRPIEELFTQAEIMAMQAAAAAGRERRAQVRLARPGGARYFQVSAIPVRVGARHTGPVEPDDHAPPQEQAPWGVVITLRDVTELAKAVQLKTDFVANASHELRTPLSAIRTAVETLAETGPGEEQMRARLLQLLAGNVQRLEDLIRDLLDLSRLETPDVPLEIARVRGSELADALQRAFETVCTERALTLEIELNPALERLETDPRLLQLILNNLIDNASKFAYVGSAVRVVGTPLPPAPGAAHPDRWGARFEIIDKGIGIPLSAQARVFERFYQVDLSRSGQSPKRGTGLGLAIVKHATKALGGTVAVRSVWKEGTTMTIELPACITPSGVDGEFEGAASNGEAADLTGARDPATHQPGESGAASTPRN